MKRIWSLFIIIIGFLMLFSTLYFYDKGVNWTNGNNHSSEEINSDEFMEVDLFYYNKLKDVDITCSHEYVLPVKRNVKKSESVIKETIELLLKGEITNEERVNGFDTEFPNNEFVLLSHSLSNGKLDLSFTEVSGFTSGGSCRVSLLASQIKKTALQFPDVNEVNILPESIFQP